MSDNCPATLTDAITSALLEDASHARSALVAHFQLDGTMSLSEVACAVIGKASKPNNDKLLKGLAEVTEMLLGSFKQLTQDVADHSESGDLVMVRSAVQDAKQAMARIDEHSARVNASL